MRSGRTCVWCVVPRGSTKWLACASVAMSALAASGCGGSGTTAAGKAGGVVVASQQVSVSSPVGPALAQPVFVSRADAICKRRNAAIDAVKLSGGTAASIVRFASQSTSLEQAAFLELGKLSPPATMAASWRQLLGYNRELLEDVIQLEEYGRHKESKPIAALSQSAKAVKAQLLAAGTRDGFKYCSRVR
jgi:hypothetical protein